MADDIRRIRVRRDTLANWQEGNPTLEDGELVWVTDTRDLLAGPGSFDSLWDAAQSVPTRARAAADDAKASATSAATSAAYAGTAGAAAAQSAVGGAPAELLATFSGQVPTLDPTPPKVTVSNNQSLGGGPDASGLITDRKANASGWYTSIAPTDTTQQRYFAPSAPTNNPSAPNPDTWNVSFPRGGVGPGNFSHEIRVTGGQIIQYMFKQLTGAAFRILVNGRYLTPTHVPLGGTAGQLGFVTVDFGAPIVAPVNITLEATGAPFYGVIHQNASTISKIPGPEPKKLMMILDSYGGGSGQVTTLTSLAKTTAWLLGCRALANTSIGGSGWLANGNNGEPSIGNRVANDVVAQAPDVIVIGLGHNDAPYSDAQIQTSVNSAVAAIRAGLPNALIVVTGPIFSTPAPGRYTAMQAAIFAGVSGIAGVVTVDTVNRPWITAANAGKYVSSDGTHPVQLGANYFGIRYAAMIAEALAVKF
ncbi:SGNH/GDSL hydrolase family protein [Curtobacterium sp. P97]|uniref:SGNH/GDSL hydrolase family protein n=1 Tax=Curtobacterium sp. P97 TaxID=2939562 RepID=UPI00203D2777|nr:SGNH/GDSL hydrolase family protein [Curtobacterium sp. P97]MCM3521793.1 SGNH/GDSL hydrolase family protein [Curtobacterium sp. P97]